uniref:Uncharacterized protein n=1 Tax=Odontella aurita TaxID=265563 RepID=A0A7S4JE02_9STRA|mmetsp:Transcript_44599/g.136028  ORF Transcript_44599/g.136028 Transcript_44599/m.136028 type:complete len:434 (+) Transcript_44599:243-1544(+)
MPGSDHPSAEQQLTELWSAILAHNERHSGHRSEHADGHSSTGEDGRADAILRERPSPERDWPKYDAVVKDIKNADYSDTLKCPHDLRIGKSLPGGGKTLCPHGLVCRARIELFPRPPRASTEPYTGLLAPGATIEHCIVRLSSAMKPPRDGAKSPLGKALLRATGNKLRHARLFPTAAIKVFRGNGTHSGNLLFAGCKVGQPEGDYFAHPQCTQLTERVAPPLKPLVKKFWSYSDYPLSLGVSDFCSSDVEGTAVTTKGGEAGARFPFCLVIHPVKRPRDERFGGADESGASAVSPGKHKLDELEFDSFLDDADSAPEGTILFDLFACPDPASVPDPTKLQRIGRVVSTSEMVQSRPDDGLFFRHQRKEEDYDLRPKWRDDVKRKCTPDGGRTVGTVAKLAGWELFEGHISTGKFLDFERAYTDDTSIDLEKK